jgi:hypothetical protein
MQSEEVSVSLSDLSSLPDPFSPVPVNPFATYLEDPRKDENIELLSKDTNELPLKPLRRQACPLCLTQRLSCSKCPDCHPKKRACCRALECLYDYDAYTLNREA